ncbi:MAG: TlpA disulfide reductase family protein [Pseudomonadota bacterium]
MTDPDKIDDVCPAEQRRRLRWPYHLGIATVFGVIGFGAVYWTGTSTANSRIDASALQATAKLGRSEPAAAAGARVIKTSAPLPTGPGRNDLSVGDMTMFVFRAPEAMPEVSFKGPDGSLVKPADLKGKVTLMNLWATWCAPCRKEMPDLNALQKMLGGDDFEVVAVSLDRGSDAKPKAFLKEIGADALAFYHDPSARLGTKLKIIGLPATILLDREGRIVGRLVGPAKWDGEDAQRLVKAAIAAGGS